MLTHDKVTIHSSTDPDWGTPVEMYASLDAAFARKPFILDVAADTSNHKHSRWIGPGGIWDNAITYPLWQDFAGQSVFMNPPWSRERGISIVPFTVMAATLSKAYDIQFVCLFPASIQARWWYTNVWHAAHRIRHIPHRVNFEASEAMMNHINRKRMLKGQDPIEEAWNAANNTAVVIYDGHEPKGPKPDVDYWSYRDGWEGEML